MKLSFFLCGIGGERKKGKKNCVKARIVHKLSFYVMGTFLFCVFTLDMHTTQNTDMYNWFLMENCVVQVVNSTFREKNKKKNKKHIKSVSFPSSFILILIFLSFSLSRLNVPLLNHCSSLSKPCY